jgi:superfamily II DNA or RNA helicase
MKIIVNDVNCVVEDSMVLPLVRQLCRARPEGYFFMQKYKSGMWDGYISLMTSFRTFPIGLLGIVSDGLQSAGHHIEIVDNRKKIKESRIITDNCLDGVILRDYQIEAADILISNMNGVAKMATNSGKTEVMAAIIYGLNFPKTLIVLHRKELMYQTAERFHERLKTDVAIVGDSHYSVGQITIAMIQTLAGKFVQKDWKDTQLLMIDETHHASSNQMMDVLKKIPGAYRFGFSGTPLKYEVLADMKLMSVTGDILYNISNKFMIEEGYSAVPTVQIHVVEGTSEEDWNMEYRDAYEKFIVEHEGRNKIISDIAKDSTGVTLILVNEIKHGETLQKMIPNSIMVDGGDSTDFRRSVLDMMRNQESGVYISSPILDEGVDVPAMNMVILAGGGKSHVKLLQRIGRGLRKKDGDNILFVHDFLDDTNLHLFNHSEARIETYVKEGFKKSIIQNKS